MRRRLSAAAGAAAVLLIAAQTAAPAPADSAAPLALRAISPSAGPARGGNQLTIAGTGLFGVTAVRFGATVSRLITHVSSTQLLVRVPEHAVGAVDVRLVAGGRVSARNSHDRYAFSSSPGDLRWGRSRRIDPDRGALSDVSCGTPSFCVAIDSRFPGTSRFVRFDPAGGSAVSTPSPSNSIGQVACASATYCVAGSPRSATEWDGHSWSALHRLASWAFADAMTCAPESDLCVLIGNGTSLVHHADGWHTVTLPAAIGSQSIDLSCPTATFCLATDGKAWTTFDGSTWSAAHHLTNGPSYLEGLSCASADYCLLAGDYWAAEWRPTGWTALPTTSTEQVLSNPTCIAAKDCLIDAQYDHLRRWDGSAVRRLPTPPVEAGRSAHACLPGWGCVFVDDAGHQYAWAQTHAWSQARNLVPAQGYLTSVSCASTTWCLAVDDKGNAFTWQGSGWSAPRRIDPFGSLASVACVSRSFCVAVGTHVLVRASGVWRTPATVDTRTLADVSCTSVRFCMAVDDAGRAITWHGHGWSAPVPIGRRQLFAVSCTNSANCFAVGDMSAQWDGRRWHRVANPQHAWELTDVDCVSASYCTSGGIGGIYVRHDGLWSHRIAPTAAIDEVWISCLSARLCVGQVDIAEGTDVENYTFDGASTHQFARYDVGGVPDCLPTMCAEVDYDTATIGRR